MGDRRTTRRALVIVFALAIAGAMGALGALVTPFRPQELILPSVITWSLLLPVITLGGVGLAALIGILSPFLGAVVAVLVNRGVAEVRIREVRDIPGVMVYALGYVWVTAWVCIPIGLVTALVVRWVMTKGKAGVGARA